MEHSSEGIEKVVESVTGWAAPAVRADGSPAGSGITVYGAWWCGDTRRSVRLLDRLGVDHEYVDVDQDPTASAWAAARNGGQRRIPVIVLGAGGPTLIEPGDEDLLAALGATGYLAPGDDRLGTANIGPGAIAARSAAADGMQQ